jgi:glycosyltransferase involved in cell wall biosynthesis
MLQPVVQGISALQGTPVRVRVFTCFDPSREREYPRLGVMVRGYRVPLGGDLERGVNRLLPVFAHRLRSIRADLFHLWSVSLAAAVRDHPHTLIAIPDIAKLTTRYYGRIASYLHNRMLGFLPRASGVTCLTEWTRREIVRVLKLPEDRVFVVSPWATPNRGTEVTRQQVAPPTFDDPWTLLYVATDRPHKNLRFFLEVLARTDGRFRGVLVTQLRPRTRALIQKMGLISRLSIQGNVSDLTSTYRGAQILLHPSLYEGFGLPLLEAMSHGLPVVGSDRTCIPEVVGEGGRILPSNDPGQWVDAIERLSDPDRYAEASRRALSRAAEYPIDRTRRELLRTYAQFS